MNKLENPYLVEGHWHGKYMNNHLVLRKREDFWRCALEKKQKRRVYESVKSAFDVKGFAGQEKLWTGTSFRRPSERILRTRQGDYGERRAYIEDACLGFTASAKCMHSSFSLSRICVT